MMFVTYKSSLGTISSEVGCVTCRACRNGTVYQGILSHVFLIKKWKCRDFTWYIVINVTDLRC